MSESVFSAYLQLGFQHIFDLKAYDHLAFLVALAAPFIWKDLKQVVVLATSFTIGHSITLALAVLQYIPVNEFLIEFLIPVTIFLTSLGNFWRLKYEPVSMQSLWFSGKNLAAVFFGLIHGLGFSNYLKALLGNESRPVLELFSFNLGIEFGQILIVLLALLLSTFAIRFMPRKTWVMLISAITALISVYIIFGLWQN